MGKTSMLLTMMIVVSVYIGSVQAASGLDYSAQDEWPELCQNGQSQTPININTKELNFCPNLGYYKITLMCEDFLKDVTGDDMSIDASYNAFAFFYSPAKNEYEAYRGYNMHFHTPSEHTVNDIRYDAEMHIKLEPCTYEDLPVQALG